MTLSSLLKRLGKTTGPLLDSNTSHSGMDGIKMLLFGQTPSPFPEHFLIFGNTLHLRCLTKSKERGKIDVEILERMVTVWFKSTLVKKLLHRSVREKKLYVFINGVKLAIILDIEQPHTRTGADLKSTSCTTLAAFIAKAIELDYFRQGLIYKTGRRLREFYFIGVSKQYPHSIFPLRIDDFPEEMEYARQELEFLLYFFSNYGKPTWAKK